MLLISTLLLLTAAGCGSANNASTSNTTNAPSGNETATNVGTKTAKFSYLRPVWGPATYKKGGPFEKELFEKANVDIDVQIVPISDYDTKVKTIIAAGTIPDVIWGSGPDNGFWRDTAEQGAYLPINQYLDKYPAIKESIPDRLWELLKDKDGNIYFLPNTVNPDVQFMTYYRQDWFEKLGIPEPKTTADFEAALEKIRETPIDGEKKVPLTVSDMWNMKELATAFDTSLFGWEPSKEDPNKLQQFFQNPKQIDFFFWVQNLTKKGLIDPDFLVSPNAYKAEEKFKAGNDAVLISHYNNYPVIVNEVKRADPNAKVGIISPLVGPGGVKGGVRTVLPIDRGFYVSAKAKDPEGIFRYLDWELTEGHDMMKYGVEGKNYTIKDGKKVSLPENEVPDDYKRPQMEPFWTLTPFSDSGVVDWEYNRQWMEGLGVADMYDMYKTKFEEYTANKFPDYRNPFIPSATDVEIGSKIYEDNLNSIIGGLPINQKLARDDWNRQVDLWLNAGGSKIIEEVNANQTDKSKPVFN